MPYDYATERPFVFSEEGQKTFLAIRDRATYLLAQAGAVRCHELLATSAGDSWHILACVDRLIELGELRELPQSGVMGQFRVFVRGKEC